MRGSTGAVCSKVTEMSYIVCVCMKMSCFRYNSPCTQFHSPMVAFRGSTVHNFALEVARHCFVCHVQNGLLPYAFSEHTCNPKGFSLITLEFGVSRVVEGLDSVAAELRLLALNTLSPLAVLCLLRCSSRDNPWNRRRMYIASTSSCLEGRETATAQQSISLEQGLSEAAHRYIIGKMLWSKVNSIRVIPCMS